MKPVVIQWVCRSVCAHLFLINRWRNRNLKIWMKTKITKRNKATAFVRILCIVGRSASTEKRSLSNQITIRNMALRIKSKKNITIHSFTWRKKKHYMVSVEVFFVGIGSQSLFSLRQRIVAYGEPHTFADTFTLYHSPHGTKKVEQIRQRKKKNGADACVCVSRACLISLYRI